MAGPAHPRSLVARLRSGVRAFLLSDEPPEWFWRSHGVSAPTASGVSVTDQTALRITAVLSCVKVLAESISTLPLMVFAREPNGDKRPVPEHPLSQVLHTLANEESTAQSVRETLSAHVLLRGNAYARVVRDGSGEVHEIWPIAPGCIQPERRRPDGPLLFRVSEPGLRPETLRTDQVWRIPGLSWGGATGLSPIGIARESLGLAIALEQNTASALRNGARIAGVVTHPTVMEDPEFQRFKSSWDEAFAGVGNAGKTVVLEQGAKFEKVGMTFEDLQFLELKKFQVAEIARLFRVPLHMLFDDKAQPRANMEQASLEFLIYTLRPWLVRFEQTIVRDLLLPSERGRLFAEHNVAGLLRGDFAARMQGYSLARQWGWLSVNDIRRLENQNGIGPEGDVYLQPLNMTQAGPPRPGAGDPPPAPHPQAVASPPAPPTRGYALALAGEGKPAPTLYLYDIFGLDLLGGITARQVVADLQALGDAPEIEVRLNSPGGDVFEGIAVHNALARHPGRVVVHVDGLAASIASLVAMGGDEIRIAENAMVMVHPPWALFAGDAAEMRREADTLDKAWTAMLATYAARTGRRPATLAKQVADAGGEWWMTAEEAVASGFADRTERNEKAAAVFGLERFRHVPASLAAAARDAVPLSLPAFPRAAEIAPPRVRKGSPAEARRRIVQVLALGA
jgi:HK97 family phage portal protein